jgi:hypothetical protein
LLESQTPPPHVCLTHSKKKKGEILRDMDEELSLHLSQLGVEVGPPFKPTLLPNSFNMGTLPWFEFVLCATSSSSRLICIYSVGYVCCSLENFPWCRYKLIVKMRVYSILTCSMKLSLSTFPDYFGTGVAFMGCGFCIKSGRFFSSRSSLCGHGEGAHA